MGDVPPKVVTANDASVVDSIPSAFQGPSPTHQPPYPAGNIATGYQPAFQQHIPHQHHDDPRHNVSPRLGMAKPQGPGQGAPYNMGAMANALPQPSHGSGPYHQGQQRFSPAAGSSATLPNQLPIQQYPGQPGLGPAANHQYYLQQHPHMAPYYSGPLAPSQAYANMPRQNLGYYPGPVTMSQPAPSSASYYYAQMGQFPGPVQGGSGPVLAAPYMSSNAPHLNQRFSQALSVDQTGASTPSQDRGSCSSDSRQNVVRGPPRKPRQSGHAIWIGNLPPQTDLMNLVHHVCKETSGLESLFLISKSNCAFANFKDEQSCAEAQQKLHDSRFETVRLVSRLRKSTVEGAAGVSAPTGPAASTSQGSPAQVTSPEGNSESERSIPAPDSVGERHAAPTAEGPTQQKDSFFILKSLTLEDLELSVRTGIWATQSHNEENLNKAFESVDNVYLIFSANKSGEYFGYARMVSPINDDPTAAIEFAPKAQSTSDLDLPRAIPTEATEFAPKGRIIDDSARGTIFWEAEADVTNAETGGQCDDEGAGSGPSSVVEDGSSLDDAEGENKAWGKPFKLEWLSNSRLPFHRTRGLRNPWNSNREVKIARDGTELEPSVGRRLIGLFNKPQNAAPGVLSGVPGGLRGPVAMMPGFPPMHHPYQL